MTVTWYEFVEQCEKELECPQADMPVCSKFLEPTIKLYMASAWNVFITYGKDEQWSYIYQGVEGIGDTLSEAANQRMFGFVDGVGIDKG